MPKRMIGYVLAAISGSVHGLMNVTDKYLVSHRVKRPYGYAVYVGAFNVLLGVVIALFLNWSAVSANALILPIIAGILYGAGCYMYYSIMNKEDASQSIGLMYVYPLLVGLLSTIFLNERLHGLQYVGVIFTIMGAVLLSVRLHELKLKASIWALSFFIVSTALIEFLSKMAVETIPAWNGSVTTFIAFGSTILLGLFSSRIRADAKFEFHNAKWTSVTESLNFIGNLTMYGAMTMLPATIVSSICTIQPLSVLLFEKLAHKKFGKMVRDEEFGKKLLALCCIVVGIIFLYVFG